MSQAKAQMEVMGLAIIMILLALGLLFVVQSVMLRPKPTIKQEQTDSQLAANFISTLMQTTTNCNKFTISNLVQNCAQAKDITCNYLGKGTVDSCSFVNYTVHDITKQTLVSWGRSFNLTIGLSQTGFSGGIHASSGDCTGEREASSAYIKAGSRTITIRMYICR